MRPLLALPNVVLLVKFYGAVFPSHRQMRWVDEKQTMTKQNNTFTMAAFEIYGMLSSRNIIMAIGFVNT